jgi:prolyl-tRNA editing enzyme YbaK/EbsC (Cys-tRNA(Pro) deacylase)
MAAGLSPSARRIQQALAERGKDLQVVELPQSTRTAAEAAAAIGCTVAQIAKSIVFRAAGGEPLLVVASGANRIDEAKVADLAGVPIGKADAAFVREKTGFAIGGIPPFGHDAPIATLLDRDLLLLPAIWAAAGTPNAVFRLDPRDLVELTAGRLADVKA